MKAEQLPFDLGHRAAHAREDFWVSGSNAEAVAWIDKWPDWPAPLLIIYGPAASGKTHLSRVWEKKSAAAPFTAGALAKEVLIDDAEQFIGGAEEENLFHLYNSLKEKGGHMLMTAARPPRDWGFRLPDLKSRVLAAPAVAMGAPDDQLMAVVLTKLFSDRQIFVPQDVVQFILPRIERSFSALRDVVEKIDQKALAQKRPVTIPLVKDVL